MTRKVPSPWGNRRMIQFSSNWTRGAADRARSSYHAPSGWNSHTQPTPKQTVQFLSTLTNCPGCAMARIYPRHVILVQPDDKTPGPCLQACQLAPITRRRGGRFVFESDFSWRAFLKKKCAGPALFEENFRPEPCKPRFG